MTETTKEHTGLDGRHRDKSGRIERKHNNTKVGHLRETYGKGFAPGFADSENLGAVLQKSGASSLSKYLKMKK